MKQWYVPYVFLYSYDPVYWRIHASLGFNAFHQLLTYSRYLTNYLLPYCIKFAQWPPYHYFTVYITIHSMFGSYWSIYHIWPQYHLISMASGQYGARDGSQWDRFWSLLTGLWCPVLVNGYCNIHYWLWTVYCNSVGDPKYICSVKN